MNSLALFGLIFAFCIITGLFIILFTTISHMKDDIQNLKRKDADLMRYFTGLEGRVNDVELKLEQLNPVEEE